MSIRSGELREKEDYQKYILERLRDDDSYIIRDASYYVQGLAMDPELLIRFLDTTQPDKMAKLRETYGGKTEAVVPNIVNKAITMSNSSLLETLKKGVYTDNMHLDLMFRQPSSTMNQDAMELYEANILSVMEEVYHKENERIDFVIFLNGIAIMAFELKCNTSGQNYEDAIRQYRNERDPNTRLTKFKSGALVFFAMDLNEVHMCTRLSGKSSFFLPFNQGSGEGIECGKGNPHNPDGINVSYMWEDILTKDTLIYLIDKILFFEKKKEKGKTSLKLIFPRYHQQRAVRRLTDDIRQNGTSRNYLIAHSAGSGKTNTIAWLAHRLASLHDQDNNAVVDTVIITTDRVVVDRQLQDAVLGMDHKAGVVSVMDDSCTSQDLADAIQRNTKIIVTTIHKFQYIRDAVSKTKDKHFAFIIDEAHSSTSGTMMESASYVLSENDTGKGTMLEQIEEDVRRVGKQPNVTIIAFTATPKPTTLELFGTTGDDGKKREFDLYSMKQAIEEGFILDVLQNYVTYETYYRLNKIIEDDPTLDSKLAAKKILKYIDLHDTNIAQKVEIIIEHFRSNVMCQLGGNAKAMVITSSRMAAVKYRNAFNDYIAKNGYGELHALVAFTGTVDIDGTVYSEESINGFKSEEIPERFDGDFYQVLIVANKFQTGFDQPKLCALYIDKRLSGVNAVQTLSRLNRICPPYDKMTFILDFKNTEKDILEAFSKYYTGTVLENSILPSDIDRLESELDRYAFLNIDEIRTFNEELYKEPGKRNKAKMWSLLDSALKRLYRLTEDERFEARGYIRKYLRFYSFLIQATCYNNKDQHMKYNYLTYLVKEIEVGRGGADFNIEDKVRATDFRQEKTGESSPEIVSKPSVYIASPGSVSPEEEILKKLSEIIKEINLRFNMKFDPDIASKYLLPILEQTIRNPHLIESAKNNSMSDFKFALTDALNDSMVDCYEQNSELYKILLNNEDIAQDIVEAVGDMVYRKLRQIQE